MADRFCKIHGAAVNFDEYDYLPSGQVSLVGRVKYVAPPFDPRTLGDDCGVGIGLTDGACYRSHPDVAERHYPDLFKQSFPYGLPAHGTA
jgi:hypothetical protein